MKRREFITLLGGAAAAWPLAARAQEVRRLPRIGMLTTGPERVVHFLRGLRDLGYVEGQSILVETRFTAGQNDRFDSFATELVALKVDVLMVSTLPGALAARRATTTIPIVFVLVPDPVGAKLADSVARPGGSSTGITTGFQYGTQKRLELFKQAVGFARIAVLTNPDSPVVASRNLEESEAAAAILKIAVKPTEARLPSELPAAFTEIAAAGISAVFVIPDAMFWQERKRIAELALRHRIASSFGLREHVDAGGLMSYGPNYDEQFYRAAAFIDKILKGGKPAELPIEQPTKFEMLLNLKTAKALGLELPPEILALANEVIE
jgi:putative ABC transport system substrate-binding protein